jgi:parvulin-like peptidyl-prolyl isomerase
MAEARKRAAALLIVALALLAAACSPASPPEEPAVAVVNGENIAHGEFQNTFQREWYKIQGKISLQPGDVDRFKEQIRERLIEEKLILQRAKALSLTVDDGELDKRIDEIRQDYPGTTFTDMLGAERIDYPSWRQDIRRDLLLQKVIAAEVNAKVSVADEEVKAAYDLRAGRLKSGGRVRVAQIFVRDPEKAKSIRQRLQDGKDFDKIAREESIGPEAVQGGDMGFFERGVMPDEFDAVVFSLKPGRISPVVKTSYGYHIFKVLEKEEGNKKSYAQLQASIRSELKQNREEEAYRSWITDLKLKASIRKDKLP